MSSVLTSSETPAYPMPQQEQVKAETAPIPIPAPIPAPIPSPQAVGTVVDEVTKCERGVLRRLLGAGISVGFSLSALCMVGLLSVLLNMFITFLPNPIFGMNMLQFCALWGSLLVISFFTTLVVWDMNGRFFLNAYEAWFARLPENSDSDPLKGILKKAISENIVKHFSHERGSLEAIVPNRPFRDVFMKALSSPKPVSAEDLKTMTRHHHGLSQELIDAAPEMSWSLSAVMKTGILVNRPELSKLIAGFEMTWLSISDVDIEHIADVMRARVWADDALEALMRGELKIEECEERLHSISSMMDGCFASMKETRTVGMILPGAKPINPAVSLDV